MEQRVQLDTCRCGLDWIGSEIGCELWWIGGEPGEQQFVVGHIVDHGLPLMCHGWLGQLKVLFGMDEIRLIEMASCDGLDIGRLESSSDHGVAHSRLVGFSRVVFDPGG